MLALAAALERDDAADSNSDPATSAATGAAPTKPGRDAAFGSDSTLDSDPAVTLGFDAGTETDTNAPEAATQESDSI